MADETPVPGGLVEPDPARTRPAESGGPVDGPNAPDAARAAVAPQTVARSAASAGAATMASRILGVGREVVLASLFGASDAMDAYRVAFRIPNLLRDLFAEGAMSAAFVPTFTRTLTTDGRAAALRLGNNVTNALLVITTVLVAIGLVFAEPLVRAFAGGYASVPGKLELTVTLTRIMLPFLTFVALAAAAMGMLNSMRHFFIPALSPAMFNVVSIVCALALVPLMPSVGLPGIAAIAIGVLIGGMAQWSVQWPLLRKEGLRYAPVLDWRDPGLRRVLLLMGPATFGLAATQVNVFVNTSLATNAGTGAVSWLDYAFRLMYLPIGLFGVSIATATTPAVARHAALHDDAAVRRTVADGLSLMMTLNVPATAGLMVLASPIIALMYQRGPFTAADTAATAVALQFYAVGLLGYSVVRILSPAFYALGRNRTPVKVSVATVLVNAGLNLMLVRVLGYAGLALGTSIAALFNACLLAFLLRRHLHGLEGRRVAGTLLRMGLASGAMALGAALVNQLLESRFPGAGFGLKAARLTITIGAALGILAGAAHLLRVREFRDGVSLVTRRLRPTRR